MSSIERSGALKSTITFFDTTCITLLAFLIVCPLTIALLGKYEDALEVLRKALEIQRRTIGPHDETVITSQEIEKVLKILGRTNEAEEAARFSKKLTDDKKRIEKAMEDLKV